jgi:hypothetical protein
VEGIAVDARSDIFALGILLWEILAGNRPFGGNTPVDTLHAILHGELPELPPIPGLGPELERLLRHCLEKAPSARFQSAKDLAFPKQMRWDAWLDDGRGELLFGRPIRWLLFLYGGRVVPFTIKRTELAHGPQVQEVTSGAVTFGHRFLATSGRPGRAVKVRTFEDYRTRLLENFVVLDRGERHDRIARELVVP